MKNTLFLLSTFTILFMGCTDSGSVLPKASGRANEVLLILDDPIADSKTGQKIMQLFEQDVADLGSSEPFFDVSRLNQQNYSEMFRKARNLVYVDISDKYSAGKVKLYKDLHASGQAFVQIQSPNIATLDSLIKRQGNRILSYLYTSERERTIDYFEDFKSQSLVDSISKMMGINILIPTSFNKYNFKDNFVWMASGNVDARQYLAIYKYDYKNDSTFTKDYLLNKRDEVMKTNIPGSYKGSYMKTSYVFPPNFKSFLRDGKYIAELRGLWDTEGDMMGGPFVSETILDEANQQVITIEGFVYAPNKEKRNLMRQLEAILYTAELDQPQSGETTEAIN